MPQQGAISPGRSFPLGASWRGEGVNFSVFAKYSTGAQLLLFDDSDAPSPSRIIDLDPQVNRTYHYWHVFVPGIGPGQVYGYRIDGPFDPGSGLRFDREKLLLDPYGKAVVFPAARDREAARRPGDNTAAALRSVVVDPGAYDWEGDAPIARPFAETIIYEMHVGGFTRHPNSGVAAATRGTYAGLIEKIPYLVELGVTAVELLPVFAFDPADGPAGLGNYWGYQPLSFFSPHPGYSCTAPGSRSSSTSSTTTPPRAMKTGRRSAFADWLIRTTTSSPTTNRAMPTSPAAATPSTPTSRSSAA
jgi:glycogen operon protein